MIEMKISVWIVAQCPYCNATKKLMTSEKKEYCYCDERSAYTSQEEE